MTPSGATAKVRGVNDSGRNAKDLTEGTEAHAGRVRSGDGAAFADLYECLAPSLDAWARLRVTGSLREFVEPLAGPTPAGTRVAPTSQEHTSTGDASGTELERATS